MENNRQCLHCTVCCQGVLTADIHGQPLGNGIKCYFLNKLEVKGCSIYNDRPNLCKRYECGFLKGYMPEEYRPSDCGVLMDYFKGKIRIILLIKDYDSKAVEFAIEYAQANNLEFKISNHFKKYGPG